MKSSSRSRPVSRPASRNGRPLWARSLKAITVHCVCFGMITMPTTLAQEQEGSGIGAAAGAAFGIIQSGVNQMMQQRQAAMQQAMLQASINQLQPQKVPSKYYPQCAVSKAVTDFPEGACEGPITGPADLNAIDAFKSLAINYESFYENLLATNQNSPQSVGVQCIEEANRKTDAQLQDKINALSALIGKIKKETQVFEQEHAKIIEEMDINKSLLYGPITNPEVKETNLLAEFSPACQNYYKDGGKNSIKKNGFSDLRNTAEIQRNQAATFENNRTSYISDLKNQLQSIRTEVGKTGIGIMNNEQRLRSVMGIGGRTFNFGSMGTIIGSSIASFQNDFQVIKRDLAKVGYDISTEDMDGNFNERMARFSKGAKDYFMKEAVNNCVNGKGATGVGLTTDQILKGLRHRRASGSSTTLAAYRTALSNILSSDAFIEDKMSAIATLDKKYGVGEVYIQVAGADADSSAMTPYGLYVKQVEICKSRVAQDDTFSTSEGMREDGSIAERIADAERAMKKAINLEANFLNELTTGIYDRVVHCEGIQSDGNRCNFSNGGKDVFTTSDNQFCIAHASNCASDVKRCYKEADVIVQKKQVKMRALAATFNERVSALVASQEFFLNQIKAQVVNDAEFIKRFIPGASYQFPDDLFVDMPEEMMNEKYGVALRGGGNVDGLVRDLPLKLDKLKDMLEGQRKIVSKQLGDYLAKQTQGMSKDAQKWSALKEKCNGAIASWNEQVAQQNQAGAEQESKMREADALAQKFCQKYNDASTNPAAGCGKADDLAKEVYDVSGALANSADVREAVQEFQYYCEQANNEGEESDEKVRSSLEQDFDTLFRKCGSAETDEELYTFMQDEIERQIPADLPDDQYEKVVQMIRDTQGNTRDLASALDRDFIQSTFYKNILQPYLRLKSNVKKVQISTLELKDLTGSLKEQYDKYKEGGNFNICQAAVRERKHNAIRDCADRNGAQAGESGKECVERREDDVFKSNHNELQRAALLVGQLDRQVASSNSSRLGEKMESTPCYARQGQNGARGANVNSGSILDMTGMDIINQAIGF